MQPPNSDQIIKKIAATDPRYDIEAYYFIREALDFTRRSTGRQRSDPRDVSSKELLDGIRRYGLETFGPMTPTVLAEWRVFSCEDFGEIVFNLLAHNVEGKSEGDSREDFKGSYTFDDAFGKPFRPTPPAPIATPNSVVV